MGHERRSRQSRNQYPHFGSVVSILVIGQQSAGGILIPELLLLYLLIQYIA